MDYFKTGCEICWVFPFPDFFFEISKKMLLILRNKKYSNHVGVICNLLKILDEIFSYLIQVQDEAPPF